MSLGNTVPLVQSPWKQHWKLSCNIKLRQRRGSWKQKNDGTRREEKGEKTEKMKQESCRCLCRCSTTQEAHLTMESMITENKLHYVISSELTGHECIKECIIASTTANAAGTEWHTTTAEYFGLWESVTFGPRCHTTPPCATYTSLTPTTNIFQVRTDRQMVNQVIEANHNWPGKVKSPPWQ